MATRKKPAAKTAPAPTVRDYLRTQIPKVLGMFRGRMTPAMLASNLGDPNNKGSLIDQAEVDAAVAELIESGVLVREARSLALKVHTGDVEVLPPAEEVIESTSRQVAELTPEQKAAANFKEALERAELVKQTYEKAVLDFTTEAGQKAASEALRQLVSIRVRINEQRLAFNESARAEIKANDVKAKALVDMLAPVEQRIEAEVSAWRAEEKAKAEAKAKAKEEERMRVERAVAAIREPLTRTEGLSEAELVALQQEVANDVPTVEVFGDRFGEAVMAHDFVLRTLEERRADAARRDRMAAEDRAMKLMNDMRAIAQEALGADVATIETLMAKLKPYESADFAPLQDDGVGLYDRLMSGLRMSLNNAKEMAEAAAERDRKAEEERQRQAQDMAAMQAISRINALVMGAARATPAEVDAIAEQVKAITIDQHREDFSQAVHQAGETLAIMRDAAVDRERAEQERRQREEREAAERRDAEAKRAEQERKDEAERQRAATVDSVIRGLPLLAVLGAEPTVARVEASIAQLEVMTFDPAVFLDRAGEASTARDEALAKVRAELEPARERQAAAEQAERDRQAERQRQEAASERARRINAQAEAMFDLLVDIEADEAFEHLDATTVARIRGAIAHVNAPATTA